MCVIKSREYFKLFQKLRCHPGTPYAYIPTSHASTLIYPKQDELREANLIDVTGT